MELEIFTDEQIAGQNLTTNPDVKYRRDRFVSDIRSYKRCAKTQEFLNYCSWLLGERNSCTNSSTTFFDSILRCVRNNSIDKLPNTYKVLHKCYTDLIERASKIMTQSKVDLNKFENYLKYRLGEIELDDTYNKDYYSNIVSMFKKDPDNKYIPKAYRNYIYENLDFVTRAAAVNLKATWYANKKTLTHTPYNTKNAAIFDEWLQSQLDGNGDASIRFAGFVSYYVKYRHTNASYIPSYVKSVCDKYIDRLINYRVSNGGLHLLSTADKDACIKSITNAKNVKSFENGYEVFRTWLQKQLNGDFSNPSDRFAGYVTYYNSHYGHTASYMPMYVKPVCDEFSEKLKDLKYSKGNLVSIETSVQPTKIEEAPITSSVEIDEVVEQPIHECKCGSKPSFNDLLQALKDFGIKEFTIKF